MKTKLLIAVLLLSTVTILAQNKNYVLKLGETELGLYFGTAGKISSLNSNVAGYLDFKGAVVIDGKWAVGLSATGLYYDKKLNELVADGTYHLYVGYSSFFVERIFSINDDFKFSLSINSGYGEAYYRYDRDFRKDKIWTEEVIDKNIFYVFEPGIEIQHRVGGNFWLGLAASYRNTSPLELLNTSDALLQKFSGGISFKWGIF